MPKIKDPKKVDSIHAAAMKLVINTGFSGLKMADVASQAGMATGTLYIYYKSKELLINAIYFETKKEIIEVLTDRKHISETFYQTFRNMWLAYFLFCMENPEKMMFVEQFLYSGYIENSIYERVEEMFAPLNAFLLNGQQNGIVKQLDIEIIKAQMEGSIHEIIKMMRKKNITFENDQLQKCFEMAWDGIKQ